MPAPKAPNYAMHRGKKFTLKANGLPNGYALYWVTTGGKQYLYTKFHGRGLSCKTLDWRAAVDFVEDLREKREAEEDGIYNDDLLISDLLDDYLKYLEAKNLTRGDYEPETAKNHKFVIEASIKPFFGKLKASQLVKVPEKLTEYRTQRTAQLMVKKRKPADEVQNTIDKEVSIVRSAYYRAQKSRKISKAIIPNFEIDKANSKKGAKHGIVTDDQFEKLMQKLPRFVSAPFALDHSTGVRKKESRFIHRSEVDWRNRIIHLRTNETKSGKARSVGVPNHIWPYIVECEERTKRDYPEAEYLFNLHGQQLTTQDLDNAFEEVCEELGWHKPRMADGKIVKGINGDVLYSRCPGWHDTRRTATTDGQEFEKVTDLDRQRTFGMTDTTLDRYAQTKSAERMRDAADRRHEARMNVTNNGVPITVSPIPVYAPTVQERLVRLKDFFDQKLIDETDYRESKTRLLAEL